MHRGRILRNPGVSVRVRNFLRNGHPWAENPNRKSCRIQFFEANPMEYAKTFSELSFDKIRKNYHTVEFPAFLIFGGGHSDPHFLLHISYCISGGVIKYDIIFEHTPWPHFKKSGGFGQGPIFLTKWTSVGRKPESKKLPDPVFRGESNGICENILRFEFRRNPKIQFFGNSAPEFLKIGFS